MRPFAAAPHDDVLLFFKRSSVLGIVDHRFLSAGFQTSAAMADGSALPSWLHFDPDTMRFTGTSVLRIEDGMIAEELGQEDAVTVLKQLGLVSAA